MIRRAEELSEKEGINKMVDGEYLFKWELGILILSEHAIEEVALLLKDVNMKHRGNMGLGIIIFDNEDPAESNNLEDTDSEEKLDEES